MKVKKTLMSTQIIITAASMDSILIIMVFKCDGKV